MTVKVARSRPADAVFRLLAPGDSSSAAIEDGVVSLDGGTRPRRIALTDVIDISHRTFLRWSRVAIAHDDTRTVISGLPRTCARAFVDALRDQWKLAIERRLSEASPGIESAMAELLALNQPRRYLAAHVMERLLERTGSLSASFPDPLPGQLARTTAGQGLDVIRGLLQAPEVARRRANAMFVEQELARSKGFFDAFEAHPLTEAQRRAIVVDEDANLVVAAAGSGKTSVIAAKAAHLAVGGFRHPSEILLLAFSRDARAEMQARIQHRVGGDIGERLTVMTFHALGLSVLGAVEGKVPSLARVAEDERAMTQLLRQIIHDLLPVRRFAAVMTSWFQREFAPYRSLFEFRTWGQYWDYIRAHEIRSLQGEQVKSFEECEIANFLFLNGIPYAYERAYEHDTATPDRRQYQPDFYLPMHGIYIEHFAISREGNTPPFIPRDAYLQGITWKRRLHEQHGTTLLETYSYEKAEGVLTSSLEAKLAEQGVELQPMSGKGVFGPLEALGRVDAFTSLTSTFLQHFKSAGMTIAQARRKARALPGSKRCLAYLKVFTPIFERYQALLEQRDEIDFNDMIIRAADHVEAGRYVSPYRYILVDEFQDISPARARLLKALLGQRRDHQLFAVGDDWQSIYRFAGSDISIMREFAANFGVMERSDLEQSFRLSDRVANSATRFILENPAQLKKQVTTHRKAPTTSIHIGYGRNQDGALLHEALARIASTAPDDGSKTSVLLLGRYRHLRPTNLRALQAEFRRLSLDYKTIHRAKGLEADHVVVLGVGAGRLGFPTEMTDDPILDVVLAQPEGHTNAEERRLFYVALTRSRGEVYLISNESAPSSFVQELEEEGHDVDHFGPRPAHRYVCPTCKGGELLRRHGKNGDFYGCSNYPYCDRTEQPCPSCGKGLVTRDSASTRPQCGTCSVEQQACPDCDEGWLVAKVGKYGGFFGCSTFPACEYTRSRS